MTAKNCRASLAEAERETEKFVQKMDHNALAAAKTMAWLIDVKKAPDVMGLTVTQYFERKLSRAKRRAKLSRVLGKRALKSFHPRLFNDRLFAGETWSDKNGCTTRNQATAFC